MNLWPASYAAIAASWQQSTQLSETEIVSSLHQKDKGVQKLQNG